MVKTTLSPKELAQAIGVSESSLKRWADKGVIRVVRTAGGHRRITVSDAIRFIRESRATLVDPRRLGLSDVSTAAEDLPARGSEGDRLYQLLRAGNAAEARGLVVSLYLSGHSLATICDGPIKEAMWRLGDLWRHDPTGIFVEHRATDICIQTVNQLRLVLPEPGSDIVAVGGAPGGDPYLLPSLLAATVLAAEGVEAINLGPDTPFDTLRAAAIEHRARLVWLSLSAAVEERVLLEALEALSADLAGSGASVVLGGQAAEELDLPRIDNLYRGRSMGELVAFARGALLGANRES